MIKGRSFFIRIIELIDDVKMNREMGTNRSIKMCIWHMKQWFMECHWY